MHCLHGDGIDTPASFHYTNSSAQWNDQKPSVSYGDGDGTVNLRSLHGCRRWLGSQSTPVVHKVFPKAEHLAILNNDDVKAYIASVVTDKQSLNEVLKFTYDDKPRFTKL